jgi:hypothetical protein
MLFEIVRTEEKSPIIPGISQYIGTFNYKKD